MNLQPFMQCGLIQGYDLSDPMAGSAADRAERIREDITKFKAEALIISRIPGASHCAVDVGRDDQLCACSRC